MNVKQYKAGFVQSSTLNYKTNIIKVQKELIRYYD